MLRPISLRHAARLPVLLAALSCSTAVADGEHRKRTVTAEPSADAVVLGSAEIVEARLITWVEAKPLCRPAGPVEEPVADGRLLTLRRGDVLGRLFVANGRVIHCTREVAMQTPEASWRQDRELSKTVEKARRDLAERLSLDAQAIAVGKAERVRWRDSSAGCPSPDRVYMQVLTDGSRIVLVVDDREYLYHHVEGGEPFRCESPSKIEPLPGFEIQ